MNIASTILKTCLLSSLFVPTLALTAEVDNFTAKTLTLPDQSRELNELTNKYLYNVVAATNHASNSCDEKILKIALKQVFSNHMKSLLIKDILGDVHFSVTKLKRQD